MVDTRKTLFLYPKLDDFPLKKQREIFKLIEDLKIIVNISNQTIENILRDSSFAYIRCLPCINIEEVHSSILQTVENVERVRICVIGYNETDYEKSYSNICKSYAENHLNISHLVGLKIRTDINDVNFLKPEDSSFNLIIETGLVDLENILVSIMLDISIYHYFSLNNNLSYRKCFSSLKMKCIIDSEQKSDYGDTTEFDKIRYLPFSYPYVKKITDISSIENVKVIILKMIKDYFQFITSYVLTEMIFDKNKELEDPYSLNEIPKDHLNYISEKINEERFMPGNNYCIIINNQSINEDTIGDTTYVIKDDEYAIEKWLSSFPDNLNDFSLYYIKIGA